MNNQRKLTKSSTDKWAFGVLGGFAKYFNIDCNKLRIGYIIFSLLPGPSVIIYLICALIMPSAPEQG
mgnify:FL=1